ncbi:hypothetical protein NECAME_18335 [Necator americanus]|uniref:Uncharacterized protein n=1 Tax=Necator americanus TaxID=51031 RepID=W2SX75_NECAM|nr:hypothetical protein NECAME_18335 [Necator americanus]ETN73446.1 hypothetical protein NECAME_18335 [Necator americanus]
MPILRDLNITILWAKTNILYEIRWASDDTVSIIGGGTPRPAQPLPREEPLEDPEEKARLISQVLELQNTLDGTFPWFQSIVSKMMAIANS